MLMTSKQQSSKAQQTPTDVVDGFRNEVETDSVIPGSHEHRATCSSVLTSRVGGRVVGLGLFIQQPLQHDILLLILRSLAE